MSDQRYDFTDATFFFFKRVGHNPGGALAIALSQVVAYTILTVVIFAAFIPFISMMIHSVESGTDPSPADVFSALGSLSAAFGFSLIFGVMLALSVQGAWLRFLTTGQTKPGIPLRFGGDELRLLLVNLVFIAFGFIGYIAFLFLFGIAFGTGAGVGAIGDNNLIGALTGGFLSFLVFVVGIAAVIILCIRFAAAPAMTVLSGKVQIFESFAATRNITGWMFLSYLVLFIGIMIAQGFVSGLVMSIVFAGMMTTMPNTHSINGLEKVSEREFINYIEGLSSSPGLMAGFVLAVVIMVAMRIIIDGLLHGVGAYAAVRHAGGDAAKPEDISAPAASVGIAPRDG